MDQVLNKLDISESFYMSYTGAQPVERGKTNKMFNLFKKWQDGLIRILNPDLDGKRAVETWKEMKRKKRGKF